LLLVLKTKQLVRRFEIGPEFISKLDMILSYCVSAIQGKWGIEIEKCEEKRMRSRAAHKYNPPPSKSSSTGMRSFISCIIEKLEAEREVM
jgi:hypothetical protein